MNRGKSHTGSAQLTIPQAVIMLVIFLAVQLVTTLVVAFVIGEAGLDDSAMTAVASGLAAVINTVWMTFHTRRSGIDIWDKSRAIVYSGESGRGMRIAAAAAATILLAVSANIALNGLVQLSGVMEIDPLYAQVSKAMTQGPYPVLLIVFGVLVPVAEEIAFRGIFYRAVRQRLKGTTLPIMIASLGFAIYHGNLTQGLYALFVGVLLCVVCEAGGLIFAILLHIGINLVSLAGSLIPCYTRVLEEPVAHWPAIAVSAVLTIIFLLATLRLLLYVKVSGRR